MTPRVQDGSPLVSGVVRAEDQRAEISGAAEAGPVPLTPAQAAARARDDWPTDPDAPPGYTRHVAKVADDRGRAARRDESAPDTDAWQRVDSAQAAARGREDVATAYKQLARRARKLIAAEDKLAPSREKAAEGARIKAEIAEAREALVAARVRAGV